MSEPYDPLQLLTELVERSTDDLKKLAALHLSLLTGGGLSSLSSLSPRSCESGGICLPVMHALRGISASCALGVANGIDDRTGLVLIAD